MSQALPSKINEWTTWQKVIETACEGDLVEIQRTSYCHWAMICGNGIVAHVINCNGMGQKRVDKLELVVEDDKCRINNLEEEAKARNLVPKSMECILESISDVLKAPDKTIDVRYHVVMENCEIHVTEWRYGRGFSVQVQTAASAVASAIGNKVLGSVSPSSVSR